MKNFIKRTFSIPRLICAAIGVLLVAVYFDKINNPVWLVGSFVTTFGLIFLLDSIELVFFTLRERAKEGKNTKQ